MKKCGTIFTLASSLSLTKSKLKTSIKNHFLKVACHEVINVIDLVFVFWHIYCKDFICKIQKQLVILIFRTFRNYILKKKKKTIERWPLFLLPCILLGLLLQPLVSDTLCRSTNTPTPRFVILPEIDNKFNCLWSKYIFTCFLVQSQSCKLHGWMIHQPCNA